MAFPPLALARGSDRSWAPLRNLVTAQSIVARGPLVGFTAEAVRTPKAGMKPPGTPGFVHKERRLLRFLFSLRGLLELYKSKHVGLFLVHRENPYV